MLKTRLWRIATAALAASALLMTTIGGASAQPGSLDDLDESQLNQLSELLGSEPADEDDDGTALDDILEELGLEDLDELLDLLDEDNGDNGDDADDADIEVQEGEAGEGNVPDAGIGGFIGTAHGTAMEIGVGLPAELADGLEPLLDGLGIRDGETGGIRIVVAETEAELQRAAEGEEVEGLAKALITNFLLDSEDSPGACEGTDTIEIPPEQETPLLRIDVASIDCEQDDERAFADAQLAGVEISLAGLIEAGFPEEISDGIDEAIASFNEELLTELNEGVCDPEEEGNLNDLFGGLFGDDQEACDALEVQLRSPFDVDVPVAKVDLLGSTSEVTANDEDVAAEATAMLEHVNVLGLTCVGGDGQEPLQYQAWASTDGSTGEQSTAAPDAQARLCENEASILRLITDPEVFESLKAFEADIQEVLGGSFADLFDGLEELFAALETTAVTDGAPYGDVDGVGAVAGVTPLSIVATAPLSELPGFDETPLADISVSVAAMEVEAAVNAAAAPGPAPAGDEPEPAPEPAEDLPVTGASAALLGMGALAAGVALRRREDDES